MNEINQRVVLDNNFKYIGNQLLKFDLIDSTNSWLKRYAPYFSNNINIVANKQLAGRGRLEKKWIDEGENFAFSILINNPPFLFHLIPIVTALAVYQTLRDYIDSDLMIKWPNDILVEDKKISGILCERINNGKKDVIIIGIGINIKTAIEKYPKELQEKITALDQVSKKTISIEALYSTILAELDRFLDQLIIDSKIIIKKWNENSHSIDRRVSFQYQKQTMTGSILGIDEQGYLLVRTNKDKEIIQLISGEVLFL